MYMSFTSHLKRLLALSRNYIMLKCILPQLWPISLRSQEMLCGHLQVLFVPVDFEYVHIHVYS